MGDPRWSSLFLKDGTSREGPHAGAVHEELQPMGRIHVEEGCGELVSCGRDPMLGAEQECEESSP